MWGNYTKIHKQICSIREMLRYLLTIGTFQYILILEL